MKRYDLIEFPTCGTYGKEMEERPDGDYCEFSEFQAWALDLKALVEGLEHTPVCQSQFCMHCDCRHASVKNINHPFFAYDCNCPRGDALRLVSAALGGAK